MHYATLGYCNSGRQAQAVFTQNCFELKWVRIGHLGAEFTQKCFERIWVRKILSI